MALRIDTNRCFAATLENLGGREDAEEAPCGPRGAERISMDRLATSSSTARANVMALRRVRRSRRSRWLKERSAIPTSIVSAAIAR